MWATSSDEKEFSGMIGQAKSMFMLLFKLQVNRKSGMFSLF